MLCAAGAERVRILLDSEQPDRLDRIRSASTASRAGLPVDLHLAVRARQRISDFEALLDQVKPLPVSRIVVSTRQLDPALEIVDERVLGPITQTATALAYSPLPPATPICLEGYGFHPQLVLEAIEDTLGSVAVRRTQRHLVRPLPVPHLAAK